MAKSRETSPPGPPHLIVAFLNTKPCDQYRSIKVRCPLSESPLTRAQILGDIEAGIATQCLAINKAIKGNLQYFGNVSLKVCVSPARPAPTYDEQERQALGDLLCPRRPWARRDCEEADHYLWRGRDPPSPRVAPAVRRRRGCVNG